MRKHEETNGLQPQKTFLIVIYSKKATFIYMEVLTEIVKENFKAISQYENQPIFFFRYNQKETEYGSIICNEITLIIKNATYESMVSALIGVKYTIDAQLALLYNYQSDSETYGEDMRTYQDWRNYCKESAREFFGIKEEN